MPYDDVRASVALEFVGTFILVTSAASTSVWTHLHGMDPFTVHFYIAIVVSAVVGISILTMGKLSGAHLNPSVSLSHAITGVMPRPLFFAYLVAQLLAALAAGIFLSFLCHSIKSPQYGLTKLQEGTSPAMAIALEAGGTFVLCAAALLASTKLKHSYRGQAGLMSLVLFLLTVAIGPFTGASFNPSRSLGPAVAAMNFEYQYIYWVGPIAGSILGSILVFSLLMGEAARARANLGPTPRPNLSRSGETKEEEGVEEEEVERRRDASRSCHA